MLSKNILYLLIERNLKSYLLFCILASFVKVDLSKNILKIKEAAVDRK